MNFDRLLIVLMLASVTQVFETTKTKTTTDTGIFLKQRFIILRFRKN